MRFMRLVEESSDGRKTMCVDFLVLGGKGNYYFLSNMNRAPTECELGANGDKKRYKLELRLIAHFGLVRPLFFDQLWENKNSFSLVFQMQEKVACYEQSLEHDPLWVIMNLPHSNHNSEQSNTMILYKFTVGFAENYLFISTILIIVVADVPGIVPGASREGQGLGSQFLRHIERCLALLLIIDMSVERPWEQYELLMGELREYKTDLTKKPITVLANKMDDQDAQFQLAQTRQRIPYPVLPISTTENINIDKFLSYLRTQYDELITDEWRERLE